ncbi:malate synthase A [Azoarcus communis]|uniref:Malate synthase n=1 Tax=Parazoarcus communis SWub3 = DSM 12120 TaxID=1121029 RepID=A0A323VAC6_9RHOO|nr:malate synthase A [Parazoarcus communis]NMG47197.1 malate synthase A [Parazoarcus communis]NMG70353.1 malate synthase A [Parazoarcus communis SWub3 = DSM 12120]PZA17218.1 malate synthase A [Azoarcus communis] [Parazoarcus communis SWub3 = DSM 12120]
MSLILPHGMQINAPLHPRFEQILSPQALDFVARLHRAFEPRRRELLAARVDRQARIDAGEMPGLLPETRHIREGDWKVAPLPKALECRRVEITGPVERKMIINAFNSGADSYMTDFEDSNSPNWFNQIQGQVNLYDAVRREITYTNEAGKEYRLNDKIAVMQVRPRGWHLDEKHVLIDGERVSGGLFDFALFFFHNAREQIARGAGPFFYLPKLESHQEARLWNDIFCMAQDALDLPRGTIKATVLLETILATFEMEEILYELREHSAGLNAGRWDYIFSCIKKFKKNQNFCLANRGLITMEVPFMRSYALALVQACHKRGAPAIGGMSALIPIKHDPEANEKALAGIRHDKNRDASDGYDGGWVAHPGLVPIAMEAFTKVLGDRPNQWDKQVEGDFTPAQWLDFRPEQPITEAGLRNNINVGIHYLGSWLTGNGCVPIHNLMEDAATAEIARAQVWQWVVSPKGVLDDGRKVDAPLVRALIVEELAKVKTVVAAQGDDTTSYDQAAGIFENMSLTENFPEFLTLPLYEAMA